MVTPHSDRRGTSAAARVQIYILSRDRASLCRSAVESALAQTRQEDVEVVVSDNSVGAGVEAMVRSDFPQAKLIRRSPPVAALEHFKLVLEECSADFVVLFHDDDVMLPNFVEAQLALLAAHPQAVAAGANALILRGERPTRRRFMGSFDGVRQIARPEDLLRPYLEFGLEGPAPFPGYMYRRRGIEGLHLQAATGGKHADVTFLLDVLSRGPLVWASECLFRYRFHGGNDSGTESVGDRLRWLRHLTARTGLSRHSLPMTDARFQFWLRWLGQMRSRKAAASPLYLPWRQRIVLRFVACYAFRMAATRATFWKRLGRRLLQR